MENNRQELIRGRALLETASRAWQRMAELRANRRRFCRFTYGDQWSDTVRDRRNREITEAQEAIAAGSKPLTNNLIRRMVKAVVGRFRMDRMANGEDTRNADPDNLNHLDELDARTLEEFLISGVAVHRVCREQRVTGNGRWVDNIPPDRFFVSAFSDPRGGDIEMAGVLHDMSVAEVVMRFCRDSRSRAASLVKLYSSLTAAECDTTPMSLLDEPSFFRANRGRCRVIELWTLECRERLRCHDPLNAVLCYMPADSRQQLRRLNASRKRNGLPKIEARWELAPVWRCRYLAPDGTLLDSFDSPLADGSLPLAIRMYPLVGGEVHSLVEDVIGQQKYVNRLITLMDHIMGVSAKGALLFPVKALAENDSWENLANRWATPGAVIPYSGDDGVEPRQVSTPACDIGAKEMLQTQIQLFEDISGVNGSLMGKSVSGAVGAQRYESELRNSAVSILDLLQTFNDFISTRNRLLRLL